MRAVLAVALLVGLAACEQGDPPKLVRVCHAWARDIYSQDGKYWAGEPGNGEVHEIAKGVPLKDVCP